MAAARSRPETVGGEPGRYITLGAVFTKNPKTHERNIGMYRVQLFEPKLAAMHWHMHHDGARHFRMYQRRGERMPLAMALGGPAVLPYAATCPLPPGIDECLFAGFLQGRAIELVPCVTQPEIEVPATAEIVIEGYIDPAEEPILEGPFGDHTGFYSLADYVPAFSRDGDHAPPQRDLPRDRSSASRHRKTIGSARRPSGSSCRCCRRLRRTSSTTTCRCSAASTIVRS